MTSKVFSKKRMLICSAIALGSGLLGCYVAVQIGVLARTAECQKQPEGLNAICQTLSSPAALAGAFPGMWTGTILGAFIGGLVTRQQSRAIASLQNRNSPDSRSRDVGGAETDLGLTRAETEALAQLLLLLKSPRESALKGGREKKTAEQAMESVDKAVSLEEFLPWAIAAAGLDGRRLTQIQARLLLQQLGLNEASIDAAWQKLNAKRNNSSHSS